MLSEVKDALIRVRDAYSTSLDKGEVWEGSRRSRVLVIL